MIDADLIIILARIEGEQDSNFLALLQGFASWFVGGDDQEFDLAQAELVVEGGLNRPECHRVG